MQKYNINYNILKKIYYKLDPLMVKNTNLFYSFSNVSQLTENFYQINHENKLNKLLNIIFYLFSYFIKI